MLITEDAHEQYCSTKIKKMQKNRKHRQISLCHLRSLLFLRNSSEVLLILKALEFWEKKVASSASIYNSALSNPNFFTTSPTFNFLSVHCNCAFNCFDELSTGSFLFVIFRCLTYIELLLNSFTKVTFSTKHSY